MKNISVIGAGTMGNGIAQTFAQSGFTVHLFDVQQDALKRAEKEIHKNLDRLIKKSILNEEGKVNALNKIHFETDFIKSLSNCDLMIEAATENEKIKLEIFKNADEVCKENGILASNTSSISISKIASITKRPQRVIGMHFMNPVPVMKLVEVVSGIQTSKETEQEIISLSELMGKIPVKVNDYPGFISNRILIPMINEAIYCLYEGVAGVHEIDSIMTLGMAHPMGPLQLADFIGLDVCLSILNVLYNGFKNPKYAACPLLVNMVTGGFLGVKSGKGFYTYEPNSKEKKVSEINLF